MSESIAGIFVWDRSGDLCQTTRLEHGLAPEALEALSVELEAHVVDALAGRSLRISVEWGGRTLECSLAPLFDAGGAARGVVSVVFDASARSRADESLAERLAFEAIITKLSTRFVTIDVADIHDTVGDALSAVGEFAKVDRVYVFRFTSDGTAMDNTHEWCAEGIEPQIDQLQGLPFEELPWWTSKLRAREVIHIPDVNALPAEASRVQKILLEQDIKSVLVLPMVYERAVVGFIGFDSVRAHKTWPEIDIALLRITSEILVTALERERAEGRRAQLEAQLIQARSLENVARLAGGVAHDFNNLLAVILNYTALLKSEISVPAQREKLDELHDTARRAADLTRQLLLVGRRDVVEPVVLDANVVVESILPLIRQSLGETIAFRFDRGADLDVVRVGLPQLERVIVNLALNARDAMPDGGSFVVSTENVHLDAAYAAKYFDVEPGNYVRLRVADTGFGMRPEVMARAFEPFFTTKGTAGTGLGLSTAYGIIKQAGGHIAISSEVGAGTNVDVLLPVIERVAPAASTRLREVAPQGSGEMILVVEDSPNLRQLVCKMLLKNNYRVIEAATPEDAAKVFDQRPGTIDMLFTDVIMPRMTGAELAKKLLEKHGFSCVLYMSGYDDEVVSRHGVLEAGTHLLQKPFEEADMLRAVRHVLDEARRDAVSAESS